MLKIGALAERSGVSVRSLRYYEEQGILVPTRDAAGHRRYESGDINRVRIIQELYAAGFCSSVIRDLMPAVIDSSTADPQWMKATFDAARARLEAELCHVERELRVLADMRARIGLAPDAHVRGHADAHEDIRATPTATTDHRDRRLR